MPPKDKTLTKNQIKFIEEYIETLNPIKSAVNAGYPDNTAKYWAQKLLSDKNILSAMDGKIAETAATLQVPKAFFTKKLLEIIEETTRSEEVLDRSGNPTGKTKLKDAGVALRAIYALANQTAQNAEIACGADDLKILCVENLDENKI